MDTHEAETWFDDHYRANEPAKQYRQLQDDIRKHNLTVDNHPLRSSPKPVFMPCQDRSVLAEAAEAVNRVLGRVAAIVKQREDASRFLGFDRRRHAFLFSDPGYPDAFPVVRHDTFYDVATGHLRFIEFNTHSPSCIGLHDRLIAAVENVPTVVNLKKQTPYRADRLADGLADALIGSYRQYSRRKGRPFREAPFIVVMASNRSSIKNDVEQIAALFQANGMACEYAYPQQIAHHDGRLSLRGKTIDILYRDAIHDFAVPLFSVRDKWRYGLQYLAKCLANRTRVRGRDLKAIVHENLYLKASPLAAACRTAAVCLVNPLFAYVLSSKLVLALLYDDQFRDGFTAEQRQTIETYIPWTHVLKNVRANYRGETAALVDLVKSNKDRLVIKPALGYGGYGVVIGCQTSQRQWNREVSNAMKPNRLAVVQEFVAIPRYRFPDSRDDRAGNTKEFNVNLNLWSFNGRFCGAFVRAAEGAVINLHAGGMLVPVFYI